MKTLILPPSELIPIQTSVDRKIVLEKLAKKSFRAKVVPYHRKFLIRDGTHSSCAAEMKKIGVIAHIYESDEEFARGESEFAYPYASMAALIEDYETQIRRECARQGIHSVKDLADLVRFYSLYSFH